MKRISYSGGAAAPASGEAPDVQWGPDFGNAGTDDPRMGIRITSLEYNLDGIAAGKDSWADIIAACPVDVTHDQMDLQTDSVVATRKDIYIGFDLTALPAGATVIAATFRIKPKAGAAANDIGIFQISTGSEGWTEAGLKCSNAPSANPSSAQQTFTVGTAADEVVVTLNSSMRSYIQGRMGSVNTCTFLLRDTTTVPGSRTFESTDDGGVEDPNGPRLSIQFSVPV